jgi:DNA-binding transcriptional ArsR family regulator
MPDVPHGGLVDQRLAKALSHPLRARIFAIVNEQVASPNEVADMLGEPLPNVSHHTRVLVGLECIELVRTARRRGAVEHYYRRSSDRSSPTGSGSSFHAPAARPFSTPASA